jgi:hypothetical protein
LKIPVIAVFITITGLAFYRGLMGLIGFPGGMTAVFPIAFFPLLLPMFLGVFFQREISREQLRTNVGMLFVCFGVGIAVTGQFLFANEAAIFAVGRVLTLGWTGLMLPLLVNLLCFVKPKRTQALPMRCRRRSILALTSKVPVPTKKESVLPHAPFPEQPASLAIRDQLSFYRERLEATHLFEKPIVSRHAEQHVEQNLNEKQQETAPAPQTEEMMEVPLFPGVWSLWSRQRMPRNVVAENTAEDAGENRGETTSPSESAVSRGSLFRKKDRRADHVRIRLKNHSARRSFDTAEPEVTEDSPVILPIPTFDARENQSRDSLAETQPYSPANFLRERKIRAKR